MIISWFFCVGEFTVVLEPCVYGARIRLKTRMVTHPRGSNANLCLTLEHDSDCGQPHWAPTKHII